MASKEQANVFRKHRAADDKAGNIAWASRVGSKALEISPAARERDVETAFELAEGDRVLWRILHLPRRYTDLEHARLYDADELRSVLRALVAADVVDVVDADHAKALIPAEIKKARAAVQGKEWRAPVGTLQARVYRPEIDGGATTSPPTATTSSEVVDGIVDGASGASGVSGVSPPPRTSTPPPAPVRPASGKALNADEAAHKASLVEAAAASTTQDHYVFFGVRQNADDGAIRTAYVALARDYHPDRLAGSGLADDVESRTAIDTLFRRLGDAYQAIGTKEARSRYDHELSLRRKSTAVPTTAETARARRPVEARNAYTMAETFLKKKDFTQAETYYKKAMSFDAEEPVIQIAFAWCIFLNTERPERARFEDARKRLEDITKTHKLGDAYYKLGRILRELNDDKGAMRHFESAVKLAPGHVDAQRELRLDQTRREKANADAEGEKGLLNKLFKRK